MLVPGLHHLRAQRTPLTRTIVPRASGAQRQCLRFLIALHVADECLLHYSVEVGGSSSTAATLGQPSGSGCGENRQPKPHAPMLRS
jgi:hypothetical protein